MIMSTDIKDLLVLNWPGCFSSVVPWHLGIYLSLSTQTLQTKWVMWDLKLMQVVGVLEEKELKNTSFASFAKLGILQGG